MLFRKKDIRFSWDICCIFAIPVAVQEQVLSDNFLESGVISSYLRHIDMPLFIHQTVR